MLRQFVGDIINQIYVVTAKRIDLLTVFQRILSLHCTQWF